MSKVQSRDHRSSSGTNTNSQKEIKQKRMTEDILEFMKKTRQIKI